MTEFRSSADELPEPQVSQLGGTFEPETRQRIEDFLHSFRSFEPSLVFLYSDADGTEQGSWSMQAINETMAAELAHMYAGFGAVICFDMDGLRVIVPQLGHIEDLDKGSLKFSNNRLISAPASME